MLEEVIEEEDPILAQVETVKIGQFQDLIGLL